MERSDLSPYLEYQRLHALVTYEEVEEAVEMAAFHGWRGIGLPPFWIKKARRDIGDRLVGLSTVIGYPMGFQRSEVKGAEVELALKDGATDLEIAMNLSAIKVKQPAWVKIELMRLGKVIHDKECLMTVIVDLQQLTEEEAIRACQLAREAGCDYIKNTIDPRLPFAQVLEQIKFLEAHKAADVGIKAAGNISTVEEARTLLAAGAEVICIAEELKEK